MYFAHWIHSRLGVGFVGFRDLELAAVCYAMGDAVCAKH